MNPIKDTLQHYSMRRGEHLIWCGVSNPDGYGRARVYGEGLYAHRLAWEETYGPIPLGVQVLHLCDTPPCIEPEHLYLGTRSDNMQDIVRAGNHHNANKIHCPAGHSYDEENTYYFRVPSGVGRACRACRRDRGEHRRLP